MHLVVGGLIIAVVIGIIT
ncbi:Protein of unknown function [Bacillus mycoides]|uniref:Uncharacterized protein n=1 Tax=Bacillus mycoides TaxID=1405 RepID=A0A1C4BUW1_BACMY|nr:Protein of unknown function [Bacillus mycoides]SCC10637.1 Protein of unknown function [Bacillus mycoides]SCM86408.1 Protein of unknown function [Bacillus mycoides]